MATYGDMLRVPGSAGSLADARAAGARVDVVYGISQAVELARQTEEEVVFFATGFETTAVATAAEVLRGPPRNLTSPRRAPMLVGSPDPEGHGRIRPYRARWV